MNPEPVTGAILAGGESRRMGSPKPMVLWQGRRLIDWAADCLKPVCGELMIIANSGDFSDLTLPVFPDPVKGLGPAAGIAASLRHAAFERVAIISCDTPLITPALFRHLLDNHGDFDVTIAGHGEWEEPLIGIYSKRILPVFTEALLQGNAKPWQIIRKTNWQRVEITPDLPFYRPDLFLNLNTPEDLNKPWHS